jgi:hypothetical protein
MKMNSREKELARGQEEEEEQEEEEVLVVVVVVVVVMMVFVGVTIHKIFLIHFML